MSKATLSDLGVAIAAFEAERDRLRAEIKERQRRIEIVGAALEALAAAVQSVIEERRRAGY